MPWAPTTDRSGRRHWRAARLDSTRQVATGEFLSQVNREKPVHGPPLRVLFLSQRNAARSVIAEAIANSVGRGQIEAFSAGVRPAAEVDPIAAELLQRAGLEVPAHPPQHVRDFSAPQAQPLDFVFTLSDTAAGEAPPLWPGHPITAHWHCADPEQFSDEAERRIALGRARTELERRLRVFANLPVRSLDRLSLQAHVDALGDSSH
jgi:arsenate reductase